MIFGKSYPSQLELFRMLSGLRNSLLEFHGKSIEDGNPLSFPVFFFSFIVIHDTAKFGNTNSFLTVPKAPDVWLTC